MNSLSRLSLGQRIVLVTGLAAVLIVIAGFLTAADTLIGWTGYAPLSVSSREFLVPGGLPAYARLLVWLAAVVMWVAGSLPLMAGRPGASVVAPGGARAQDAPGSHDAPGSRA